MKRSTLNIGATFLTCLFISPAPLSAAQFGLFTYEVVGDTVTITDFPEDTVGHVEIPSKINGRPVTGIGLRAFEHCRMTSVTIPEGVTYIRECAFHSCKELIGIAIPSNVTHIMAAAFASCTKLTAVTLPESVTYLDFGVFWNCSELLSAVFLGDAPAVFSQSLFDLGTDVRTHHDLTNGSVVGRRPKFSRPIPVEDSNVTIYYLSGSKDFTSPTWLDYPAVMIDENVYPAALWLLRHDLPYDTDLGEHPSLLMAYAFDLDPGAPQLSPVFDPATNTLSLSFHADSPGITYAVETTTDLENWSTVGVRLSDVGADGRRTAIVDRDSPNRFLRLRIDR